MRIDALGFEMSLRRILSDEADEYSVQIRIGSVTVRGYMLERDIIELIRCQKVIVKDATVSGNVKFPDRKYPDWLDESMINIRTYSRL